jgi:cytochrome c-type biogenesis protein CcmH
MAKSFLIALWLACAPLSWASAAEAPPLADDPALEARVMKVAEELRCLVCQNETIAASHADLAVDLRNQIRLKLREGQSPTQIVDFMVERYGDFVRYRPPLKPTTVLLWAGPFVLLVLAFIVLARNVRQRRVKLMQTGGLSEADTARARSLLDGGGGASSPAASSTSS